MVKLLYAGEHMSCPNYDAGEYPAIEEVTISRESIRQVHPRGNKLVFVLEGQIEYSTGQVQRYPACKGHIFFLTRGRHLLCRAVEDSILLVISIFGEIRFCDHWSVEDLYRMKVETVHADSQSSPFLLEANEIMYKYLDVLTLCYRAGLRCCYYNEGKARELMYIFRAFYPKEDLMRFFSPALAADSRFSQQVMSVYSHYGNLKEMASAMNYTVSGFEKKFRRVFGCSPYHWMLQQKALEVWHSVMTDDMDLKEIADKFGFGSTSSFNTFFKQQFGISPGKARQNIQKGGFDK
ncbi:AraC family transcriptional regulator [Dysgonomonas sp. 521]|uniref:helix-turn-helix domain-containing protein n=1 Tax=Dysgonomonas sp. 521 TaxID=2302932 RepID=UPI0013D4D569|nr:helix-turn-helix domain-containing protein [Dysgonomonas sp. 521]